MSFPYPGGRRGRLIHDLKNTLAGTGQPEKATERPRARREHAAGQPEQTQTGNIEDLRGALQESIGENELLRERVMELEALLAEAGLRITELERRGPTRKRGRRCRSV